MPALIPPTHDRRSSSLLRLLGRLFVITLVGMTSFEIIKELIHPTTTLWQSHVVTILFSGCVAVLAGFVVLRRQAQLQQVLAGEIAERTQVEKRLRHTQEELEQQ